MGIARDVDNISIYLNIALQILMDRPKSEGPFVYREMQKIERDDAQADDSEDEQFVEEKSECEKKEADCEEIEVEFGRSDARLFLQMTQAELPRINKVLSRGIMSKQLCTAVIFTRDLLVADGNERGAEQLLRHYNKVSPLKVTAESLFRASRLKRWVNYFYHDGREFPIGS